MEKGVFTCKISNFDPNKVFKFITQVMCIEGKLKGVDIVHKYQPVWKGNKMLKKLPMLQGDKLHLQQILMNLVKNALKFTPGNGKITIKSRYDVITALLTVSVEDTGIGIEPDDLNRLFKNFSTLKTS